jgi:hypothetical protein
MRSANQKLTNSASSVDNRWHEQETKDPKTRTKWHDATQGSTRRDQLGGIPRFRTNLVTSEFDDMATQGRIFDSDLLAPGVPLNDCAPIEDKADGCLNLLVEIGAEHKPQAIGTDVIVEADVRRKSGRRADVE